MKYINIHSGRKISDYTYRMLSVNERKNYEDIDGEKESPRASGRVRAGWMDIVNFSGAIKSVPSFTAHSYADVKMSDIMPSNLGSIVMKESVTKEEE